MGKHAYLIMAHNNIEQLQLLLRCIDYKDNDIFLHLDKRCKEKDVESSLSKCVQHSKLYFLDRKKISWGGFSQIECKYDLIKAACETGSYDYLHHISGIDLPLYPQEEIHAFFDLHAGKEFVSVSDQQSWFLDRIRYYYPADTFNARKPYGKIINKVTTAVQKSIGVNRIRNMDANSFYIGEAWFSVTGEFARYVVENFSRYKKILKHSFCADELLMPTMYMKWQKNPRYIANYTNENFDNQRLDIVRAIDWNRGKPYTYRYGDYDMLMDSKCMFARKFDIHADKAIVDKIVSKVCGTTDIPM